MKIFIALFTVIILSNLTACNSSSTDNASTADNLPVTEAQTNPSNTAELTLSIMPNYLISDEEVFVYDLTDNNALVKQTRVYPDEQGLTTATLALEQNHIYKIVFNPNNNRSAIRCSLPNGCIETLFSNNEYESIAFGQPINTRLQLAAIVELTGDQALTVDVTTDLVAQLVQSNYVDEVNSNTLKQTQSVLANTLGFLGYNQADQQSDKSSWNYWNMQAFNAALLFENRLIYNNVNDHLGSIFRRLYFTLIDEENLIDEFNQFYIADADLFLQDIILNNSNDNCLTNTNTLAEALLAAQTSTATNCVVVTEEEQYQISRLRAYLLSKNIYPEKGYLPSPYVQETDLVKSKSFLNDFRSILYTFENNDDAYDQVNTTLSDGYELIDGFTNTILVDVFPLFNDVLDTVPLNSNDGSYQLNDLNIVYQDSELEWVLTGQYQDLILDLTIRMNTIQLNATEGNLFTIAANGTITSNELHSTLTDAEFEIKLDPADDIFSGTPDGSGFIAINAQNMAITKQTQEFTGAMTARIELHLVENIGVIETLESASIFGTLFDDDTEHQLSVSMVHPNVNQETSENLIPNGMTATVTYSAAILGLGEPLLTVYMDLDNAQEGLSIDNIDMAAYFEGRLAHFTFAGRTNNFTYQGQNQDGVEWFITLASKEADGYVSLTSNEYGTPRVLKDLVGIMFNDGNFISIF
ncbi:hypothetical protein Q4506_06960 [Colwellia sp. 4_MG-2023]|uniref:hypothetical protein n=1 Tax=unclassified Colwellia TaxID=196834 RepID=UPI0026E2E948|nr:MULTISPECIES: hypothetical protein [unclassified Colwellia]MDO6507242.1 hypothetical protein [Colwellia sp. 5_MG-2023]MDO6555414.1 hypothetical protein [Colwellia sp. 4_MG-2023]